MYNKTRSMSFVSMSAPQLEDKPDFFTCDLQARIGICTYLCFPNKGTPDLIIRLTSCLTDGWFKVTGAVKRRSEERALENSSIFKRQKQHLVIRLQRRGTRVKMTPGRKTQGSPQLFSDLSSQSQEKCLTQQFLRVSVQ